MSDLVVDGRVTAVGQSAASGTLSSAAEPDWAAGVKTNIRLIAVLGLACVATFAFGFGAWASLVPLASAVVAQGVVVAAGDNLQVQHLEGGIVKTILVKEGDKVAAGEPLVILDETAALAMRNRMQKQFVALSARAQRLIAERDDAGALTFSDALVKKAGEEKMLDRLDEQRAEFEAGRRRHQEEKVILQQREESLKAQIVGMSAQQTAVESQIAEVRDEADRKKGLLDRGLTNRSEYSALVRTAADLLGQLGQAKSTILSGQTQIMEAEAQLARLSTQRIETAVSELNDVRSQISDVEEQLGQAEAVLSRVVVRAPSAGIVVSMDINSPGVVVKPGATILELLPTTDLVVEAHISPRDADAIGVGRTARLRFSALNARTTPVIDGVVSYLSADRLVNRANGEPYYLARLKIVGDLPPSIEESQIYPGSPVDTYIALGDRTFMDYLVKPITDSFARAFKEE